MEEIQKILKKYSELLKCDEMLCACYLYDYENNHTDSSYDRFNQLWSKLKKAQKIAVVIYFYSFNDYEMLNRLENNDNKSELEQKIIDFQQDQGLIKFMSLRKMQNEK